MHSMNSKFDHLCPYTNITADKVDLLELTILDQLPLIDNANIIYSLQNKIP